MQRVVEFTYKGQSTTYLYQANIGEVGPVDIRGESPPSFCNGLGTIYIASF